MTTSTNRFTTAIVALILASALSSVGWIFEGEAVARLSPFVVACASLVIGGGILVVLARMRGPLAPHALDTVRSSKFFWYAFFRSAVLTTLFAYCLTLTSSTKTMFLTKIEPYIVLLIQIIWFNHRTTAAHLVLLAVHIIGAVILSTGGSLTLTLDTVGDFLIFLGVICNAALYAPSQKFAEKIGSVYAAGFSQLYGGLILLPWVLLAYADNFTLTPDHLIGWYYVGLVTITFYMLSTVLWFFSLREVPAWLASALRCTGPIVAAPIAWFVFGKGLPPLQLIGALLVVSTSVWMVVIEKRR